MFHFKGGEEQDAERQKTKQDWARSTQRRSRINSDGFSFAKAN